jgi:hypothetical protein
MDYVIIEGEALNTPKLVLFPISWFFFANYLNFFNGKGEKVFIQMIFESLIIQIFIFK